MLRFVKQIVWLLGILIGCQSAFGFALIGPVPVALTDPDGFQASPAGQQIGYNIGGGESGVPKNVKEEYRRNTPVLYYAFDDSFRDYFGEVGKAEVDKALAMYNSVGKSSTLNIDDYPEDSRRVNFRAQADSLIDLKSVVMGLMTEQLGFFQPTRWVWVLHDRVHLTPGPPCPLNMNYFVFQDNFSIVPVGTDTFPTTTYVNGVLYSYFIDELCGPAVPFADAVEFPVDPLTSPYSAVADFTSFWYAGLPIGGFYTSLTRDDVAAMKYLLATNNLNNEAAGSRTTEFVTNNVAAGIQTQDLGAFAALARVSTAAQLTTLFPGLVITSTTINPFGKQITTNITQFLVNAPTDPAGTAPSHALFSTNYTTNIVQFFDHTFANVVTNSFSTKGIVGSLTLGLSVPPFSPAGTVGTLTTNSTLTVRPLPVTGVFGDFLILPTNQCGALILSNLLTTVTATTNLPILIVGPTTNSITFTPGSITFTTNHFLAYLPVTCPLDAVATRGGVDRILFVRRDFDAISGQVWDPITNDYTMTELDITNATISLRHFQRRVPRPDFVFLAADLVTESGFHYTNIVDGVPNFDNFSIALFGFANFVSTIAYDPNGRLGTRAGPGTVISPPILPTLVAFNRLAPLFFNASAIAGSTNNFLTPNELTQTIQVGWGSFDGTTNAPVLYPNGTSLTELEDLMIGPASNTPFLPDGNIGVAYSAQLLGKGGQPPYTWALAPTSPGLPDGLNISSDGKITGTPAGPASIYDFTVRITDSAGVFRDIQFTITIF